MKKEKSECHENFGVMSPVMIHGLVRIIFDSQHWRQKRFEQNLDSETFAISRT